jgi:hypothetical protein
MFFTFFLLQRQRGKKTEQASKNTTTLSQRRRLQNRLLSKVKIAGLQSPRERTDEECRVSSITAANTQQMLSTKASNGTV